MTFLPDAVISHAKTPVPAEAQNLQGKEPATVDLCRFKVPALKRPQSSFADRYSKDRRQRESRAKACPRFALALSPSPGISRTSYPKSELPEAESVCSTESVGQPVNSTRRCAVPVNSLATDPAYRLNYHIIWEQAVVIRLCEVIRLAHCLTLLSPRLANHSAPIDARKTHIYQMQSELFIGYNSLNPKYYD